MKGRQNLLGVHFLSRMRSQSSGHNGRVIHVSSAKHTRTAAISGIFHAIRNMKGPEPRGGAGGSGGDHAVEDLLH